MAAPSGTRALIDARAVVRDAPGSDGQTLQLAPSGGLGAFAYDFAIVADEGEWVRIRSVRGRCYNGVFGGLELDLYVSHEALQPTLARPLQLTSEREGTLRMTPGVLLRPAAGAPGRWSAEAHPFRVELELPDSALDTRYAVTQAGARPEHADGAERWIQGGAELRGPGDSLLVLHEDWYAADVTDKLEGRSLVRVDGTCMTGQLWVEDSTLRKTRSQLIGRGSLCGGYSTEDYWAKKDSEVFWPDGRSAGHVRSESGLWLHQRGAREIGAMICVSINQWGRTRQCSRDETIEICFRRETLGHVGDQ